jgi:hypothetical protein
MNGGLMQPIDSQHAEKLLEALGLRIGGWNELCALYPDSISHKAYSPPAEALELYVVAHRLALYVTSDAWILLQIDNSTCPSADEVTIFEKLAFGGHQPWDIARQHTFLLEGRERSSTLVLLIYFALLFGWHIHLTSASLSAGQWLGLQDGTAYFFGDATALRAAEDLIAQLLVEPRRISA